MNQNICDVLENNLFVDRIYPCYGGYKMVCGLIPVESLELRSGAKYYVYTNSKHTEIYIGSTGKELLEKIRNGEKAEPEEINQMDIDIGSDFIDIIQTDWKE